MAGGFIRAGRAEHPPRASRLLPFRMLSAAAARAAPAERAVFVAFAEVNFRLIVFKTNDANASENYLSAFGYSWESEVLL